MNWVELFRHDRAALINGIAGDIEDPSHDARADRHGNGRASIRNLEAALQPLGARHGDGADPMVAEVLLHFEGELGLAVTRHIEINRDGVVNGWETLGE